MNKFQKEILDKCEKVKFDDELPLLDMLYILPTQRKHDSGYKIMYIVGINCKKEKYYLLDTYCDVVDLGYFYNNVKDLHIDIKENGIIRLWSNRQLFKSEFRVSCCTFDMVEKLEAKDE